MRRKVAEVIERSRPSTSSHRLRTLRRVLEVLPRDELFQSDTATLYDTAMRIFLIQERRKIRLFIRTDRRNRFAFCLVYWPRDIYRTELRQKIESLLMDALGAEESEFTTFFSESVLVRTYFVMRLGEHARTDYDAEELEALIVRIAQQWQDQLGTALVEEFGEEEGARRLALYAQAFPAGYRDDNDTPMAVADIRKFDALERDGGLGVHLYRNVRESENLTHFRLYSPDRPVELSDVIPMLENLGMRVLGERPYRLLRADRRELWVHDFNLAYALAGDIDVPAVAPAVEAAFLNVLAGRAESDGFNRLIVGTRLGWREVAILRAYAQYMKQVRYNFSQEFIAETLGRHLDIARALVQLFHARFDPAASVDMAARREAEEALAAGILADLERVEQLNEDRVLRAYLALIRGTLRTNWFQCDETGSAEGVVLVQVRQRRAAQPAAPGAEIRDLGLLAARRGRAPARGQGRARRAALVGPPGGLPHRGAGPGEGAAGEERGDRAGRRQGWLRAEAVAPRRRPRGGAGRGRGLLPDLRAGPARSHRQPRRWRHRGAAAGGLPRRAGSLPRGRGRQGHGLVLRHRQRDLRALRLLAARCLRLRRQRGLRPQEDGDHGARRVDLGAAAFSRARHRRADAAGQRGRHRRHVGRRVRQRDAALARDQAGRGLQSPAHLRRPRSRRASELRRARAAVRAAALELGRLRRGPDLRGRRRVRAQREVRSRSRRRCAACWIRRPSA